MKFKVLLGSLAAAAWLSVPGWTASYEIDAVHSTVGFTIGYLKGQVLGTFNDFSGEILVDEKTPTASKVSVTIQADSIDTNNKKRDDHLRSPDFFDVKKYPHITFRSTKVEARKKDKEGNPRYAVTGDLSMHGTTKSVTLEVTDKGLALDAWGNRKRSFSAKTTINRKDFAITWNKTIADSGKLLLGEAVDIHLEIIAVEKNPAQSETR